MINLIQKIKYPCLALVAFSPILISAQTQPIRVRTVGINALLNDIVNILIRTLPILIGLAIIAFFWSLIIYINAANDPAKRAEMRSYMIWSIVAFTLMTGLTVAISIVADLLGLSGWFGLVPTALPPMK